MFVFVTECNLNTCTCILYIYIRYFSFIQLIFMDLKKKGQKLEYLIFKLINFNFSLHPIDCHLGSDTEGWPNFLD